MIGAEFFFVCPADFQGLFFSPFYRREGEDEMDVDPLPILNQIQ